MENIKNIGGVVVPLGHEKAQRLPKSATTPNSTDFIDLVKEDLKKSPEQFEIKNENDLKFSAHAQKRLHSRSIDLSPEDFLKVQEAVQRARDKGSKESLILTDKAAFVVSVKNNTVITAVDRESLKENVFTNIDSTIMI
jgi:flagellar operon protein